MKLIQEIIDILSDESSNLEAALLKTKILLRKIGEKSLVPWVDNELTGYKDCAQLPEYRLLKTTVYGTVTDGFRRWTKFPIPIADLDPLVKEKLQLQVSKYTSGISAIECLVNSKSDTISKQIPVEYSGLLSKGLSDGLYVETANIHFGITQFVQILTQIRSRLLDFILELSEKIPSEISEGDAVLKAKEINTQELFNNTVFRGDNVTINIGDGNNQIVNNVTVKGDFQSLSELLKKNDVSDEDIQELKGAIDADEGKVNTEAKDYGPGVKSWMKKMMGKAVDNTWKVSVGTAGSLLGAALNSYYGWFP